MARSRLAAVRFPHGVVQPAGSGVRRSSSTSSATCRSASSPCSRPIRGCAAARDSAFGVRVLGPRELRPRVAAGSTCRRAPPRTSISSPTPSERRARRARGARRDAALMDAESLQRLRSELFLPGAASIWAWCCSGCGFSRSSAPKRSSSAWATCATCSRRPPGKLYPAEVFLRVEAGVACANGLAAGLLAACLVERNQPTRGVVLLLMATALAAHTLAVGLFVSSAGRRCPG